MIARLLNTRTAALRLLKEYKEHNGLVVGFDFDNTVYDYHNVGLDCSAVIEILQKCSKLGFQLCLWTIDDGCPNSMTVEDKLEWCVERAINVNYVNSSPVIIGEEFATKPFFNVLLDDRAGLESAYHSLAYVIDYIENNGK